MLALVFIFLVTVIMSATAVWIYRKVSGWHGLTQTVMGRPQSSRRMKIGAQQGFISLAPKRGDISRNIKLRNSNRNIDAPWGW